MRDTHTSQRHMQSQCDIFNNSFPIGYEVRCWTGVMHDGPGRIAKVKYRAQIMGGHTAVVYLEGVGAVALTHVEDTVTPEKPKSGIDIPKAE